MQLKKPNQSPWIFILFSFIIHFLLLIIRQPFLKWFIFESILYSSSTPFIKDMAVTFILHQFWCIWTVFLKLCLFFLPFWNPTSSLQKCQHLEFVIFSFLTYSETCSWLQYNKKNIAFLMSIFFILFDLYLLFTTTKQNCLYNPRKLTPFTCLWDVMVIVVRNGVPGSNLGRNCLLFTLS